MIVESTLCDARLDKDIRCGLTAGHDGGHVCNLPGVDRPITWGAPEVDLGLRAMEDARRLLVDRFDDLPLWAARAVETLFGDTGLKR